jgi:hypothetical protein
MPKCPAIRVYAASKKRTSTGYSMTRMAPTRLPFVLHGGAALFRTRRGSPRTAAARHHALASQCRARTTSPLIWLPLANLLDSFNPLCVLPSWPAPPTAALLVCPRAAECTLVPPLRCVACCLSHPISLKANVHYSLPSSIQCVCYTDNSQSSLPYNLLITLVCIAPPCSGA